MKGPLLYDFGDMVRSYTNLKEEDEISPGRYFSHENFDALRRGFLFHLEEKIHPIEKDNLALAGITVIYIQAVRFLTDYLNGDVYYKIQYLEQNLHRSLNQLFLME